MAVELDRMTEAQTVEAILAGLRRAAGPWVITPNLDHLRRCRDDSEIRDLLRRADLLVADGMPLIWASRLSGDRLPERVAGSSLVHSVSAGLAGENRSIFLLGGNPGVAEQAGTMLARNNLGLRVVGTHCPPPGFETRAESFEVIESALIAAQPDLVFVALPFPLQDRVIERLRPTLPRAAFLGVGISLSFVTGDVRRAPALLRRMGLEWIHRLTQEPRRLFRRYLIHGLPFALRLFGWAVRTRLLRDRSTHQLR